MQTTITKLLSQVLYPNFEKDIVSYGFLKEIKLDNGVEIILAIPSERILMSPKDLL